MTCDNTMLEGKHSDIETDCYYSIPYTVSTPARTMSARMSHSGHGEPETEDLEVTQDNTMQANPEDMENGIDRDAENCIESICEQLDSCDIIGRDTFESHSRSKNETTDNNGAQRLLPDFQQVYVQDRDGDTMLHLAIIHLQAAIALQFISISPSCTWLNLRNHMYQTALHLAVLTKQLPILRRLIVGGADVESRDRGGNTPLHVACRDGFIEGVRALLEPVRYIETKQNNYDIPYQKIPQNLGITNYDGVTALHLAASHGHLDIVKLLIEKNANVNIRDGKNGRSILHQACADGDLKLVRFLLKCNECDINLKTYDDFTPFDFARARSYERITYELAVAGAKYANENEEYD